MITWHNLLWVMIGRGEYYLGETEEESEAESIIADMGAPSLPRGRQSRF